MKHRVLIADDVVFSIDVLKHFINSYGIGTNCVTSGRQAIDLIRKENTAFSAVFIDQMMPEMDGIQTARGIREIGTKYAGTVPLIAISANSAIDDKGLFLCKGFQDFISKPIDVSQLDAVIRRWILFHGSAGTDTPHKPKITNTAGTFNFKIGGISIQRCPEHFGGNEALFVEFLRSFTSNIPDLIKAARIGAEDMKNYAIYIHGIKGSCCNICADELSAKAGELEKAAKAEDFDFVSANNEKVLNQAEELIKNIKRILNEIPS
jgi:CheY-like chemotaxis protein